MGEEVNQRSNRERCDVMDLVLGIFMLVLAGVIYFIPTIVAVSNDRQNTGAICLLNLFLGWKLIGWVGALVWASTTAPKPKEAQ